MLRTGARILRYKDDKNAKRRNCLERERDFSVSKIWNFENVPHGSTIFKIRGATSSGTDPSSKTTLKGEEAQIDEYLRRHERQKRRFLEDVPSESAIS